MFFDDEPHGVFLLIDNKSFYASCEAVARGLNPLKVPLVVLSEAENTNGGLISATSPEILNAICRSIRSFINLPLKKKFSEILT